MFEGCHRREHGMSDKNNAQLYYYFDEITVAIPMIKSSRHMLTVVALSEPGVYKMKVVPLEKWGHKLDPRCCALLIIVTGRYACRA